MTKPGLLDPAEAFVLLDLIAPTPHGIASRVLAKTCGGNVTLFAFDAGEGLSEHTAPLDALVVLIAGSLNMTIGGAAVVANAGTIVRLPANVPHALEAPVTARLLLIMLREHPA
jgi:quercetin dioxygenase-like cupin family protein